MSLRAATNESQKTRNKNQETKRFSTFAVSRLRHSETKKKHCLIRESSFQRNMCGSHKRESKNAKQMRNTKQNCFSHSSASPRNDKQCSAKQCFANQTNRCLAGFANRSDLFRDNEHG